jgi:tRNA pseudouridine32 synthase/23S rRNA pseudouridine746 synthase/23S rRNA pseudouridine1911/1915/1917 synthase
VGDKKYGKTHDAYGALALHAKSISFTHPVNGRRMFFETSVPVFFTRLIGTIVIPAE